MIIKKIKKPSSEERMELLALYENAAQNLIGLKNAARFFLISVSALCGFIFKLKVR